MIRSVDVRVIKVYRLLHEKKMHFSRKKYLLETPKTHDYHLELIIGRPIKNKCIIHYIKLWVIYKWQHPITLITLDPYSSRHPNKIKSQTKSC